ncbi:hypothetical protein [Halomonas litopenaei]|uniref:hypothetical protein n=1 Tax=Halomonas litopenaei TaxID=2109328 RepID=UPI003FA05890
MAAALGTALLSAIGPAEARDRDPLVGPYPYDFPARASIQGSLILQEARRRNNGSGGSGSGGSGSINAGAIVNNNSTSIAVGNWQQIEMTLGDGAEGLIMTENHQTNEAEANALSKINTTLNLDAESSEDVLSNEQTAK